jgi:transcriptional regulator with XRE-family HTH domain
MTVRTKRRHLNALQQLIADHMERTGETYSDIAARGKVPRQTVSAIMNKTAFASIPQRRTLDRLAKGLGVSRETVRDAAARSISLGHGHTTDTPASTILLDLVNQLPDQQVLVLIASAREMVRVDHLNGHLDPRDEIRHATR